MKFAVYIGFFVYRTFPYIFASIFYHCMGHTAGGAVGCGTALQAGRSRVRFPMVSMDFFY